MSDILLFEIHHDKNSIRIRSSFLSSIHYQDMVAVFVVVNSNRRPHILFGYVSRKMNERAFALSVLEAVYRCGDPSAAVHEFVTLEFVHFHDRGPSK